MNFLMYICLAGLTAVPSDISQTELFKIVSSLKVDDPSVPDEVKLLHELVKERKVTTEVKLQLGKLGAKALFEWSSKKALDQFLAESKSIRMLAKTLDLSNKSDVQKLVSQLDLIRTMRWTVCDIEVLLHKHASELLALDAVANFTTYGPFAEFYLRTLPMIRRELSLTESALKDALKKSAPPLDAAKEVKSIEEIREQDGDDTALSSSKWAWTENERFQRLIDKKDLSKKDEAKVLQKWAEIVVKQLPSDNQTAVESSVYGSHSALLNTLKRYIELK